jgi:hypothetical protein
VTSPFDFYYDVLKSYVFPIHRGEKRVPAVKWKSHHPTRDELQEKFPVTEFNFAVAIPENVVVIDVEVRKGGLAQVEELRKNGVDILKTYHHYTGADGIHAFYRVPPNKDIRVFKGFLKNYDAIEIVGAGKSITIPPSVHYKTQKPYRAGGLKQHNSSIQFLPDEAVNIFFELVGAPETQMIEGRDTSNLAEYLSFLPITEYRAYDEWRNILFAVHHFVNGDESGLKTFIAWCTADEKYRDSADAISELWRAVPAERNKAGAAALITYKTLYYNVLKHGGRIKTSAEKLADEILRVHFEFISTVENDGEYVRSKTGTKDVFENSPKEKIGAADWTRLTNGVLARIQGFIFDKSGIVRPNFIEMRIRDRLEANRVSIFKLTWDEIGHGAAFLEGINDENDLPLTKEIFLKHVDHINKETAKILYPYFVKYMVSGIKANLEEFDDRFRSHSQTCLNIISEKQGIGKSTFVRMLTPCPDLIYYPNLRQMKDNETKLAISRAAMCIIDDYTPMFQKELTNLNDILTQHHILVRPKYGKIEIKKTRRAFFALTTNHRKILNDFNGTRRWINVEINDIDTVSIEPILRGMYQELYALAKNENYRHWLTEDDISGLEKLNTTYSGSDTLDAIMLNHYVPYNDLEETEYIAGVEVMRKINKAYGNNTIRDVRQVGHVVNRLFPEVKSKRIRETESRIRVYALKQVRAFDKHDSDEMLMTSMVGE